MDPSLVNLPKELLSTIFDQFTNLAELFPLRLVSQHWNTVVLANFAKRKHLTIVVKKKRLASSPAEQQQPLLQNNELFFARNITQSQRQLTSSNGNFKLDSIGSMAVVTHQQARALTRTVTQYTSGNLQHLVVYWERDFFWPWLAFLLTRHLLEASPALVRFSFFLKYDCYCHMLDQGTIAPLMSTLAAMKSLLEVDLNLTDYRNLDEHGANTRGWMRFAGLQQLLPRLHRLSLGDCFIVPSPLSALASQQLQHLTINWHAFRLNVDTFEARLPHLISITSLALRSYPLEVLEIICRRFCNLTQLKLMPLCLDPNNQNISRAPRFDLSMVLPIRHLSHLTTLELVDIELPYQQPETYQLPTVTTLTLASSVVLFTEFVVGDIDRKHPLPFHRFDVEDFAEALFLQFPSLRELTLLGPVMQLEDVTGQLNAQLRPRLCRLDLFLEDLTGGRQLQAIIIIGERLGRQSRRLKRLYESPEWAARE